LNKNKINIENNILVKQVESSKIKLKGEAVKSKLDEAIIKKTKSDTEVQRKENDKQQLIKLSNKITNNEKRIDDLNKLLSDKNHIENKLYENNKAIESNIKSKEAEALYGRELAEYNERKSGIINKSQIFKNRSAEFTDKIKILDKRCPQCGYLDPANKIKIGELQAELVTIPDKIKDCDIELTNLVEPTKPNIIIMDALPDNEITKLQNQLNEILSADKIIIEIESSNTEMRSEIDMINKNEYNIDPEINDIVADLKTERENLLEKYNNLKSETAALNEKLININALIQKELETRNHLKEMKDKLKVLDNDLIDWKYIDTMLSSNKIPALELSMVTGAIDDEATKLIQPMDDGRYSFETITQRQGKAGLIDDFDILIHDAITAEQRSFLKYSVGQKAFLNDAYVKALIKKRNERAHRTYSPIISDEADQPIQAHRIAQYYEMQKNYYDNGKTKVLIVSHSSEAHQYIDNSVRVRDILCSD
jgi:DNA repair exonuclease SbcCD ATPase subunit